MTEPLIPNPAPATTPVTHLDALPAGTRLGEFEIVGLLGVGGFGMVYQAFDHSLQRDVAIKEYMPASLARRSQGVCVSVNSSAHTQTFKGGLVSFIAEARLLAQFDHPSLVKVFRFWEENNTAYMAMPLYRGITLRQARAQMRCPPPEEWLRKLLWSMLGALKVLHNGNTMHRDISPENIFLQDIGPPVLLDLGAARRAIHEQDQQITATLKYSYAPIEQYGEAPDLRQGPWTDLYALASVVHGCVANELPLPATLRVMRDRLPSFASVAKQALELYGLSYSPGFIQAIDQALAIKPAGRPKNANAFARLMDLHVPSGMSKFDWRAELGDIYVPGLAVTVRPAQAQATTVSLQDDVPTVALPAPTSTPPDAAPADPFIEAAPMFSTGDEASTRRRWIPMAAVAVVAGLVFWLWPTDPDPEPEPQRPALAAAPAASEPLVAQAASAVPPVASAASEGALTPTPESAASVVASVAAPSRPETGAHAVAAARRPAHNLPVPEKKRSVPAIDVPTPPPSSAAPPTPSETAEEVSRKATASAQVAPPPVAVRTAETACAERNFFTRPMCIFQECQKPEFAKSALCLENARRLREPRNLSN